MGLIRRYAKLLAVVLIMGLAMVAGVEAQTSTPYVRVFVDGQLVAFDVPPVIASGRVLVPLRGVFQRLGATVLWDPGTQTVMANRADTTITLRIGNTQAQINGQPTVMDVPAMLVGGRTMVPLRFISQALGSQVSWDEASATVQINSQAGSTLPPSQTYPPTPPPQPTPPPAPTVSTVTGTVVAVNAGAYPGQIQVQFGSAVNTYTVVSATAISRFNTANDRGGSVALDALRPGDAVQVTVDQSGTAQTIRATFKEVSGKIIAVTDVGVVVLENGDTYRLNRSAQITENGAPAAANVLRPGDQVSMRVNPQSNEIWAVTVRNRASAPAGGIVSVNVTPSGRELRAGDVLEVAASGTVGGRATFSIGELRSGIPMVESTSQRGTYYGSYTVQPGDRIRGAEVVVRLTAPDGQVFTASAPTRVEINAAVPAAQTPTAPTIISPEDGASIGSPFTVRGQAPPGSRVKVTADYNGNVLLFKVNGSLGTQVVVADQSGNWSVNFSQAPPVYGVTVVITAVTVDGDGRTTSPAAKVTTNLS